MDLFVCATVWDRPSPDVKDVLHHEPERVRYRGHFWREPETMPVERVVRTEKGIFHIEIMGYKVCRVSARVRDQEDRVSHSDDRHSQDHVRDREDHIRDREDHIRDREDHVRDREDHVRDREDHVRDREDHESHSDDSYSQDHVRDREDHVRDREDHVRDRVIDLHYRVMATLTEEECISLREHIDAEYEAEEERDRMHRAEREEHEWEEWQFDAQLYRNSR